MSKTLAYGYSSESTQNELSNEYQYDRVYMVFKNPFCSCALDESSLSIGRFNYFLPSSAICVCTSMYIYIYIMTRYIIFILSVSVHVCRSVTRDITLTMRTGSVIAVMYPARRARDQGRRPVSYVMVGTTCWSRRDDVWTSVHEAISQVGYL